MKRVAVVKLLCDKTEMERQAVKDRIIIYNRFYTKILGEKNVERR